MNLQIFKFYVMLALKIVVIKVFFRFEKRQFLKLNTIEKQIELKYLPPQKANLQGIDI